MAVCVSVVIATHNRAEPLKQALDSILSQAFRDLEIIVIDDHYQDHTLDVLRDYQGRYSSFEVVALTQNVGPGAARNVGIRHARGKYVAIMDDDDTCCPSRLEQQVNLLESHPDADLC